MPTRGKATRQPRPLSHVTWSVKRFKNFPVDSRSGASGDVGTYMRALNTRIIFALLSLPTWMVTLKQSIQSVCTVCMAHLAALTRVDPIVEAWSLVRAHLTLQVQEALLWACRSFANLCRRTGSWGQCVYSTQQSSNVFSFHFTSLSFTYDTICKCSPSGQEFSDPDPMLWYSGKSNPSELSPIDREMSRRSSIRSLHSGLSSSESPSGDGGLRTSLAIVESN